MHGLLKGPSFGHINLHLNLVQLEYWCMNIDEYVCVYMYMYCIYGRMIISYF